MIELSLYYKKNDFFWFAFFHEAGHILLHGKKDLFVDIDLEGEDAEAEANAFAANILIPKADYEAFLRKARFTANAIERFAKRLGIAPGIVVGRLQHDKIIDFSECSELKESVESVLE